MQECHCNKANHETKLVVITGGPGAGKTAVLEVVRRNSCAHLTVLPEAASMLFNGGFPRYRSPPCKRAAQRAIFHVERELERMVIEESDAALALCDRGTIDGAAYWPGSPDEFFSELGTTLDRELERYAAVIHLRTPSEAAGYNHENPLRTETANEARVIDDRILSLWSRHPRRFIIDSEHDFLAKLSKALELIRREVPSCCRAHHYPNEASPTNGRGG